MKLASLLFVSIISVLLSNLVAQDSFNNLSSVPYSIHTPQTLHTPKNTTHQKDYEKTSTSSVSEISDHIIKKFTYPATMRAYSIEGLSTISFTLTENGDIQNIEILKSLGNEFDHEIYQTLVNIKNIAPIKVNGKAISQKIILPIHFEI